MAAIITNGFRVLNAENFKEDISSPETSVYVFIGKSDAWSNSISVLQDSAPPNPLDTLRDVSETYKNMIAAKIVTASDVIHISPRHDWKSGNSYVAWDDQDPEIFTKVFYVITDERKVFKCLRVGPGASTVKPTSTVVTPVALGDGYLWKYMFTLSVVDAEKFLTNFYMPVKTVLLPDSGDIDDLSEADRAQYLNQEEARSSLAGKIYNIKITNGGSGYTSTPTVTINGDGYGAAATATLVGGAVTGITITNTGSNYKIATVTISGGGGSGATAYPVCSPVPAHGTDPVRELGAYFIGVNVRLEYQDGSGDFIVNNEFRQVGLIRNPLNAAGSAINTTTTFSALNIITLASGTGFVAGDYITGAISGAVAYIDEFDTDTLIIKYHQNNKTGYKEFQLGETINGNTSGSGLILGTSGGLLGSEYTPYSGEIIFLENRDPINRSASQIEDVKIIIEF
jgi:hypothetical protein